MHGFKQRWKQTLWVEVGAGRNPNRAGACGAQVTQNVAKQIAGHHHIEGIRALHKMRGQDVDVKFVPSHIGVSLGHGGHPFIPIRHGDGNAIGLGGAGEVTPGSCACQLKRKLQHPVHPNARHDAFLHDHFSRRALEHATPNAGVFAFGVFAHDVHVDFTGLAWRAIAPHHRGHDARHQSRGAQIDVLVKLTPKQKQRAPQRHMVRDFVWHAHGAKVDRVVTTDAVFPIAGQHLPVFFKVRPA